METNIITTKRFDYKKGGANLSFSLELGDVEKLNNFLLILVQAVEDVEKEIK